MDDGRDGHAGGSGGAGHRKQSLDAGVISPQAILERSLGHDIDIVRVNPATGEETVRRARVLAVGEGVVLEIEGKIHTSIPGSPVFDSLPPGLRARPTLVIRVDSQDGGEKELELSYLTVGIRPNPERAPKCLGSRARVRSMSLTEVARSPSM